MAGIFGLGGSFADSLSAQANVSAGTLNAWMDSTTYINSQWAIKNQFLEIPSLVTSADTATWKTELIDMSTPGMNHFGTVKDFRKKFSQYSKEEFRKMGNKPVVKEILLGMTKLNKEEIQNRIAQHINA